MNLELLRLNLQFNPYHLVPQSPWPILVSFSLLAFTQSAVMFMHGYPNGGVLLTLGFIFELGKNALTIDSRQTLTYTNKQTINLEVFLKNTNTSKFAEVDVSLKDTSASFYGGRERATAEKWYI